MCNRKGQCLHYCESTEHAISSTNLWTVNKLTSLEWPVDNTGRCTVQCFSSKSPMSYYTPCLTSIHQFNIISRGVKDYIAALKSRVGDWCKYYFVWVEAHLSC